MKKLSWLVVMCFAAVLVNAADEAADKGKGKGCDKGDGCGKDGKHGKSMMMEKFDTNKDGQLSDEEKTAMKAEMEKKHAEMKAKMLEKFDANKDGQLSDEEKAVMKTECDKKREEMKAKKEALHKKYDKDSDGKLSDEERAAAKDEMEAFHKEMRESGAMMGGKGEGRKNKECKHKREGKSENKDAKEGCDSCGKK